MTCCRTSGPSSRPPPIHRPRSPTGSDPSDAVHASAETLRQTHETSRPNGGGLGQRGGCAGLPVGAIFARRGETAFGGVGQHAGVIGSGRSDRADLTSSAHELGHRCEKEGLAGRRPVQHRLDPLDDPTPSPAAFVRTGCAILRSLTLRKHEIAKRVPGRLQVMARERGKNIACACGGGPLGQTPMLTGEAGWEERGYDALVCQGCKVYHRLQSGGGWPGRIDLTCSRS